MVSTHILRLTRNLGACYRHASMKESCLTPAKLRERRHALGISQKAAAAALGVAPRTYQNWEMGTVQKLPPMLEAALEKLEAQTA